MTDDELRRARKKYGAQKSMAKRRGIDWNFTFDSWMKWWLDSGHWYERGQGLGKYVMARKGDVGPYSPDNCFATTTELNVSEGNSGRILTDEHKRKVSENSADSRPVRINGVEYASVAAAGRHLGVSHTTLWHRLNKNKPGYEYI